MRSLFGSVQQRHRNIERVMFDTRSVVLDRAHPTAPRFVMMMNRGARWIGSTVPCSLLVGFALSCIYIVEKCSSRTERTRQRIARGLG